MHHVPPLDICHIHFPVTKNNEVVNCTCKCTNSLSHIKLFKTHCNAQIEEKFRTHRKRGSSILLVCTSHHNTWYWSWEHYSRRPQSQSRLCKHRCITTLSPDVTRNELGALPSQTLHRLKLSSPVLNQHFPSNWIFTLHYENFTDTVHYFHLHSCVWCLQFF